jgi:O-antigen/teichoic acid export membrane protein
MHHQLVGSFRVALPVLGGYCILAALLAEPLMTLLYGTKYTGLSTVLAIYALYTFISYLGMITAAALRARRLTRQVFFSRLTASLLSIPIGWTLIMLARPLGLGLHAAALAMGVTAVLLAGLFWSSYRRGRSSIDKPRQPEMKLVAAVG